MTKPDAERIDTSGQMLGRLIAAIKVIVDRHAEQKEGSGLLYVPVAPREMQELRRAIEPFRSGTAASQTGTSAQRLGLLPCPFCGGEAKCNGTSNGVLGQIYCDGEECFGPRTTALAKQDSIVQWNTRTVASQDAPFGADAVALAVDKVLKELKWPICHQQDDNGLEREEYIEFVNDVLAALAAPQSQAGASEPVAHVE